MSRILKIVIGVAALAGVGLGGFYFWSQTQARSQIEEAVAALNQAGVETAYDALEIEGFPTAVSGRFENFIARAPGQGVAFAFPVFSAGMSAGSIGTVDFTFPSEFFVSLLGPDGAPTGVQLYVTSDAMTASVTPAGENAFDMAMSAGALRVSRGSSGPALEDHVSFSALEASGVLTADPAAQTFSLEAGMEARRAGAAFLAASAPGAPPTPIALDVDGLALSAAGDASRVNGALSAATIALDGGPELGGQATAPSLRFDASAADAFDLDRLAAILDRRDAEGPFAALLRFLAESVTAGGAANLGLSVDRIDGQSMTNLDGTPRLGTLLFDTVAFSSKATPDALTSDLTATQLKLDVSGVDTLVYDAGDLAATAGLTAADRLDLSTLLTAGDADAFADAAADIIRTEVMNGGSAQLSTVAGRYETTTVFPAALGAPFQRLLTRAGRNESAITLTQDQARILATGEPADYETEGGLEGSAATGPYRFDVTMPMAPSDGPQSATYALTLDGITLDERFWTALDPEEALTREIPGLTVTGDATVAVERHLLDPAGDAAQTMPLNLERVALERFELGLLGLQATADGAVDVTPFPEGVVRVALTGWRGFLESLGQTPFGRNPMMQIGALQATSWIDTFGVPGETEEETLLEVEMTPAGILINGQPFQGG